MRHRKRRRSGVRLAGAEPLEPRLPLSASSVADIHVGDLVEQPINLELDEVRITLADVHETTGVQHAREMYGLTGQGQTVAVIDTGIAYDHYALGGGWGNEHRVVGGWDFTEENDADPYDDAPAGFHGTHVAGIIGSTDSVYEGVAPGVDLVALRVFNDMGTGYFDWIEKALQWVHAHRNDFENPITTVNLSLGTDWNSDSLPDWAPLEEELAQLVRDGMFISVAAGNSFSQYYAPGLSYPAASPQVVPVASVDANGHLSMFSQRNDRVLAAPGQSIASTVPDFLFDFNGIADDFAVASGTSMAAPYVAGASVILREAMEIAGFDNITQETIYQKMRDTADVVWDGATRAHYTRLNVGAALGVILPADDYGSTASTAFGLGTVTDSTTISGMISQVDDQDFFTFTAGHSGTVTFSATTTHHLDPVYGLVGSGTVQEGSLTFEVLTGRNYTVQLQTSDGIGSYEARIQLESSTIDLGTVELVHISSEEWASGDVTYDLVASRQGILSVQGRALQAGEMVRVDIYRSRGQLIASGFLKQQSPQLDVRTNAGDRLTVRLRTERSGPAIVLANLVRIDGNTVRVFGTNDDDTFALDASVGIRISVNNVEYVLNQPSVSEIEFLGGVGHDSITIHGSSADETVTMRAGSVEFTRAGLRATADGTESIRAHAGTGTDSAIFHDSIEDDRFYATPDRSWFEGASFRNEAAGFDRVDAYSTHGGYDRAYFYDSTGGDRFTGRADYSVLTGVGFHNVARGFERVDAYAIAGGHDHANLYDSPGDDRYIGRADYDYSMLTGDGFHNVAHSFDRVDAYANTGGYDRANLHDSPGDDRFIGKAEDGYSFLKGDGFRNVVRGFERVDAYADAGGHDEAYLYDSSRDDRFIGRADDGYSVLTGDGFHNVARGFDRVDAYANSGGYDQAHLFDSPGDDQFISRADDDYSLLTGNGFHNVARGFDRVDAYAYSGGFDQAYLYGSSGDDRFIGRANYSLLEGYGYYNLARRFERVDAYAGEGGMDQAELYDSPGNDHFRGTAEYGSLVGMGFYNVARGFRSINAYADAGGDDRAYFQNPTDYQGGRENSASADSRVAGCRAYEFDRVTTVSHEGTTVATESSSVDYIFMRMGESANELA